MLLAKGKDGARVTPQPHARATCPACQTQVKAKCGSVNAWHWAHESADCDPWSEPETGWHAWWKSAFPDECQEVVRGCHRADIVTPSGIVLEIQHSTISAEDIEAREAHYGKRMMWVLDMREQRGNFDVRSRDGFHTFRWKHPRRSFNASNRMIALDLGGSIFVIKKLHAETPCGGWGKPMTIEAFLVALGGYGCNAWDVQLEWSRHRKARTGELWPEFTGDWRTKDAEVKLALVRAMATQDAFGGRS